MNLASSRALALVGAAVAGSRRSRARVAQTGTINFVIGTGAGRRHRSLRAHHRRPRWPRRSGRPSSSRTSPAPTATSRRNTSPSSRPTARWSGSAPRRFTEINPERVQEPALVDRRFRAVHPRRRGAAGVRRASERAGQHLRGVPDLGQGQPRQAQLFVLPARHAVALPRLPAQREVRSRPDPRALSRLGLAGDRAGRRPFAVRLRPGQHDACRSTQAGKLKAARHHQPEPRPLAAGRADLRRARLSGIHRARSGSACW